MSLQGVSHSLSAAACLLAVSGTLWSVASASDENPMTAVSSQAFGGYVREKLPDGSPRPETYTFGNGGHLPGPSRDDTIDSLTFEDVAKAIVGPLASQKYVPATDTDPNKTNLIIMVYWGTTTGTEGTSGSSAYENTQASQPTGGHPPPPPPPSAGGGRPAGGPAGGASSAVINSGSDNLTGEMASVGAVEAQRELADIRNAQLLGYDSDLFAGDGPRISAFKLRQDDLISEIEQNRYFLILMAYDFQDLWKQKKHRLIWVTRMSVRERGGDFGKTLPMMAAYASQFFGRESRGLLRRTLPDGQVSIGDVKSLGPVPEK